MTGVAELGAIASIIQIADVGLKLSIKLYDFAGTVASADKAIASISRDVKLTSTVLKDLGETLEKDKDSCIVNENAVQTASGIVEECLEVFREMDNIFLKRTPLLRQNDEGNQAPRGKKMMERLWWPYIQSKVLLLRSNLERLKSTLLLMLNVITYAKMKSEKSESPSVAASQRKLIRRLDRSNQRYARKFEEMKRGTLERPLDMETKSVSDSPNSEDDDLKRGADSQSSSFKSETRDPQDEELENVTRKLDTQGSDSQADVYCKGKKATLNSTPGEKPKEKIIGDDASRSSQGIESDAQTSSEPQNSSTELVLDASVRASSTNKDIPDESKSVDEVSGKPSSQLRPLEAGHNPKQEGDALLQHLKQYIILINDLVKCIDRIPEALPLSSRQTIRDMLRRAYNIEIGKLVAEHGQPVVENAEKSLRPPIVGLLQRIPIEDGQAHDPTVTPLALSVFPSHPGETFETSSEKANPKISETGVVEADKGGYQRENATIQQTSSASTVHDLLKAGWRFPVRSKSSDRLSKRLEKLKSGTGIYLKPITDSGQAQTLPSEYATHYSIGINLPNFRQIFSRSFRSLDISGPNNLVRLTHTGLDNDIAINITSSAAAKADAAVEAVEAAPPPLLPPEEPNKPIKFKDCIGRRFSFPFHFCKTWRGMEYLIKEAFVYIETIGPQVADGRYDLVGPYGEIIMNHVWEALIQPGWEITMHLWPMQELPAEEALADIVIVEDEKKAKKKAKKKRSAHNKPPMFFFGSRTSRVRRRESDDEDVRMTESFVDDTDYKHDSDESVKEEDRDESYIMSEIRALEDEKKQLLHETRVELEERKARRRAGRKAIDDDKRDGDAVNDLLALWTTVSPGPPEVQTEHEDD